MSKSRVKIVKSFSREFSKCEQKMGGGKLGINTACVRELISRNPEGALGYVDLYCLAAEREASRHIKVAAVVAVGYLSVFGDDAPLRKVTSIAKRLGAEGQIEAIKVIWNGGGASQDKSH